MDELFVNNIFEQSLFEESLAIQLFRHQYAHNNVYRKWCSLLCISPENITRIEQIPFLPISLFKTHNIATGRFEPDIVFTSSGTTQTINSRHLVKDRNLYRKSFLTAFERCYGPVAEWCIVGLLPSYLERSGSSLVYMVEELIALSEQKESGFYLYDVATLAHTLKTLEAKGQKTLLIGVTYALLDFAESCPMPLKHTLIMETGGMKGRKKEITREEVHAALMAAFGVSSIHSEYGMTELLSQAYSAGEGLYHCPPWMRTLVRHEEDPLQVNASGKGVLNIIDLANCDSCAFIATDDAGIVYPNGSFEVWGRLDNSDIRGCSLLSL